MAEQQKNGVKLAELAKQTGFSPRTIRLYITRSLLPGPLRRGRGAVYGQDHLQRLQKIRELQADGLTLKDIARQLDPGSPRPATPAPAACWQYAVSADVQVTVRADVSPWRKRRIDKALACLAAELAGPEKENQEHDNGN